MHFMNMDEETLDFILEAKLLPGRLRLACDGEKAVSPSDETLI